MGPTAEVLEWKEALRAALTSAMRRRDLPSVKALRSTLAAIENAEAVDVPRGPVEAPSPIAGTVDLASSRAPRRRLSPSEVRAIVAAEIDERYAHATAYERAGHVERADLLRTEAAAIEEIVRG